MHPLLNRQIKKCLPEVLNESNQLETLFSAIESSYKDFETKIKMIQHATTLSSEELFEANKTLRQRNEEQEKVLNSLKKALSALKSKNHKTAVQDETSSRDLAKSIEEQAKKINMMNLEKDKLLKNLEQQNESLNHYAHMVSHDLKSPIRNVQTLVTWLMQEEGSRLTENSRINVNHIFQNLEKMDRLIDGILAHATIDSDKEEQETIDLTHLVQQQIDEYVLPNHIHINLRTKLPTMVVNRYRMQQLFANLLSNAVRAVKNKQQGFIDIDFVEQAQEYRFSITDNGVGIAKHHQASIFEMFRKLERMMLEQQALA